jgi:hypothetical protein
VGQGRPWPTRGWHGRSTPSSGNTHALRHLRFMPQADYRIVRVRKPCYSALGWFSFWGNSLWMQLLWWICRSAYSMVPPSKTCEG